MTKGLSRVRPNALLLQCRLRLNLFIMCKAIKLCAGRGLPWLHSWLVILCIQLSRFAGNFAFNLCSSVPQVWRVIRTSSSSCKGEIFSRSALHPGRSSATSDSRRTARPCGTNQRNPSGQTRPVSAAPASHLHVCDNTTKTIFDIFSQVRWIFLHG